MSNVVSFNKAEQIDIGYHTYTSPPCLVPISKRAKDLFKLEEGVDALIVKGDPLKNIPTGFLIRDITVQSVVPFKVVIRELRP